MEISATHGITGFKDTVMAQDNPIFSPCREIHNKFPGDHIYCTYAAQSYDIAHRRSRMCAAQTTTLIDYDFVRKYYQGYNSSPAQLNICSTTRSLEKVIGIAPQILPPR